MLNIFSKILTFIKKRDLLSYKSEKLYTLTEKSTFQLAVHIFGKLSPKISQLLEFQG